jgi:DNA-directed RNA polymerase subunit H (RpoH/RPB5)
MSIITPAGEVVNSVNQSHEMEIALYYRVC